MPPKTRGNKGVKTLKENADVVQKAKSKLVSKAGKPPRKALADKTNSASDDNASIETPQKLAQKAVVKVSASENPPRSCRERRLPVKYAENNVLKNLLNGKKDTELQVITANVVSKPVSTQTPVKELSITISPFKTPQSILESSFVAKKPMRICRLPSKFDDHVISPFKTSPVQPCHASTPIQQNKRSKLISVKDNGKKNKNKVVSIVNKEVNKKTVKKRQLEDSSDSNNNANERLLRNKKEVKAPDNLVPVECDPSPKENISENLKTKCNKKLQEKSFSFVVLEGRKQLSKKDDKNLDVYEFTYDPNEEPPPAKKKRKKAVRKKPVQPRTVVFKNNYDKNVAGTLAVLKNIVSQKPNVPKVGVTGADDCSSKVLQNKQTIQRSILKPTTVAMEQVKLQHLSTHNNTNADVVPSNHIINSTNKDKNYNSVRVEDIAADFDMSMENYNDIDYSPVNSPNNAKTPTEIAPNAVSKQSSVHKKDPLNLRDDISFFGDYPLASSSMNMSARHPQASPWRVEFNNLPIKWQVNTYVKSNMTPAVESSFINIEDSKKKHVYTNIMAEDNEALPEIESNNTSNLKQTSIMSYIREVVERSAKKKKKSVTVTPTKESSLFEEVAGRSVHSIEKTPVNVNNAINDKNICEKSAENISCSTENKENSHDTRDNKNKKVKSTSKDKNSTFFGFDDTEDQENVSPQKIDNRKVRALRPRSRAVLQEINAMMGPMRAVLPVAVRSKVTASSDAVNKVYEEMTAADAPVFPEKNIGVGEETNIDDTFNTNVNDDDSLSVHLFEDFEVVHHLKPSRKSYGKAKKVTFQQQSSGITQELDTHAHKSSDEDDLADLTFTMPCVQQKKPKKKLTKKQKMSKKEEQEMEAWAAGFNSMCEDIEEFPLTVE